MDTSPRILVLLLAFAPAIAGCGEPSAEDLPNAVPDGTVVLTFDDAIRNHLTFVAPLLERYGFGATFFVTERGMSVSDEYLTWPQIAELHRRGFEIGSHTSAHIDLGEPGCALVADRDSDRMEARFREHGIPLPTSFAWPGSSFGPEGLEHLRSRGYRFARRGMQPELSPTSSVLGPTYDPARHSPLLIPSAEIRDDWTVERLAATVDRARDGRAVVLQFHGVPNPYYPPCSVTETRFRRFLDVLATRARRVIAVRDLERWIDPEHGPDDPLLRTRWPARDR